MPLSTKYLTLIFAAAVVLVGCSEPLWQAVPGSVMVERSSPDNSLLARVVAVDTIVTYTLEVRDIGKANVLAARTIAAPVGYHAHIVSLAWSEDSGVVTATIDRDFGDHNRVFDLRIKPAEGRDTGESDQPAFRLPPEPSPDILRLDCVSLR